MFKIVRAKVWWNSIVPSTMGWIYFCLLTNSETMQLNTEMAIRIGLYFIALISLATFGYLFNDWFDIASDIASGKKNVLAKLPDQYRIFIVIAPLMLCYAAWQPNMKLANFFLVWQVIALIIYSAPPLRLKSKAWAGVLCDAFYAHVNPAVITLLSFGFISDEPSLSQTAFLLLLIMVLSLKGIRNIILHQIQDRKKDFHASIATVAVKLGPIRAIYVVHQLLPYEIISTLLLVLFAGYYFPPFFISLLLFAFISYLKFSGWKLAYLPKRQLLFKFLYFLNDYHENWIPVFLLILLSIYSPPYIFLLLLHLMLFPNFIIQLWRDMKTIKQNFLTEEDY